MPGEGGRSTPPESGDILKHVSLTLQESGATRSTTAAEEFAIGEATVFVYQSGPSGEVLYKTVQTESSTVGVDLLFTDAVDYTYRFEAYANMGELTEAPLEVSFEDESSEGFQMHGSLSGVDASSAGSATVMLDRYVGRVVVGGVKLQWKDKSNASQEFTLKRIWLANAAAVSGGEAAYNVGGAYVASAMDALLVSEVNQVIADGGIYDVPHYLYAYASGSTALVLECEWAGQTMYYHVDYEPVANSSMTYSFSIHQTGSSEPLGDVTDDALVAAGALQANDWNSQENENHFGSVEILPYLYLEALEDNTEVQFSTNPIQYSLDGMSWIDLPAGTNAPVINTGERIYFRAEGLTPTSSSGIGTFSVNRKFNVGGNIMSMLFGDDFVDKTDLTGYDYGFKSLFYNNSNLISAKELVLPATTLAQNCYNYMFAGCISLKEAPELPATTLADYCYFSMFRDCISLALAPKLPAMTLSMYCYEYMFLGCNSLEEAPELPATTLSGCCYQGMFNGCISLKKAPELPATTLASDCYFGMFEGCKSLTEAPVLPATTLALYCYASMFKGCTSLTEAPELSATSLAVRCYQGMFEGCTSLSEAPELPATTLDYYCYNGMFKGCISLVNAPDLPATKLVQSCYDSMFDGCSSFSYIKMLATDISATGCLNNWVSGVSATGTFVKSADATWDVTGVNGVPEGWNVEVDTPVGAYVYDVNGDFYTASEWTASGNDNSTAVGVAVTDGEHSFVIHPTESSDKLMWSSNTSVLVDGVFTTEDRPTAQADFAGEANTAAILAAVSSGTIEDAPAASYCDGVEFAHGKKGYLPAAGEITLCYTYLTTINECMSAIGGTTFDMANKHYWTSTQISSASAWYWSYIVRYVTSNFKYADSASARAVSAL